MARKFCVTHGYFQGLGCRDCRRDRDRRRGSAHARGYDRNWQRMVKAAIREQPWCSVCGHRGSADNPLTGDHIRALVDGGLSTPSNIQVLCLSHNSSKGAQRKGKSAQQELILDADPPTVG